MRCPKCRAAISDTDSICPWCGQPLKPAVAALSSRSAPQSPSNVSSDPTAQRKQPTPRIKLDWMVVALGVIVVIFSGAHFLDFKIVNGAELDQLQHDYETTVSSYEDILSDYSDLQAKYDRITHDNTGFLIEYLSGVRLPFDASVPPYCCVYSDEGYYLPITSTYSDIADLIGGANIISRSTAFWNDKGSSDAGLMITFDSNSVSTALEVHESPHYYMYGVGVGSTEDDLLNSWGVPDDASDGYTYMLSEDGHQTDLGTDAAFFVNFKFNDEAVSEFSIFVNPDSAALLESNDHEEGSENSEDAKNVDVPTDNTTEGASEEMPEGRPTSIQYLHGAHYEVTYQDYVIYKNSINDMCDYVIVQIQNTGDVSLYLSSAHFDFEDETGHLVATDSGVVSKSPYIIAPGEYGYFYTNLDSLSGDEIKTGTEYTLVPNISVKEATHDSVRYDVTDTSISKGDFGPVTVIGRITNNTGEDASMVWVAIVLFDEDNQPIAAYGTTVSNLEAGSTQSFDADAMFLSHLDFSVNDVARYEVYACKPQYQ